MPVTQGSSPPGYDTCAALERVITTNQDSITNKNTVDYGKLNRNLCHLIRLLFISKDSAQPLRPPKLGISQFMPVLSMKQEAWPDLPFAVTNGIVLSLNLGYAGSGVPESAKDYLGYCKTNGTFRSELLLKPTFLTASNALKQIFGSQAWKSIKWRDNEFGFSYSLDENETEKKLWKQVENLKSVQTDSEK